VNYESPIYRLYYKHGTVASYLCQYFNMRTRLKKRGITRLTFALAIFIVWTLYPYVLAYAFSSLKGWSYETAFVAAVFVQIFLTPLLILAFVAR